VAVSAVVVGCTAIAAAGCEKNASGTVDQSGLPVIKAVALQRPETLDPALAAEDPGARPLLTNVYQTLLTIPPEETTPVPDAGDCQFDTPTTYTCTVRPKLTFHNGHELTAADVKFSVDRLRTVPGARRAAALFASVKSVDAPDKDTVVFTLRRPDATLPYALTTPAASIVDDQVFAPDRVQPPTEAIGSGAYRVQRFAAGVPLVLERYPGYKGYRTARNARVQITYVADAAALLKALRAGTADVATGVVPSATVAAPLQNTTLDAGKIGYWAFHLKAPSGQRAAVRRAVAQVLDRETLVRKVYGESARAAYSIVPNGFEGHVDAFQDAYGTPDRAKATALLRTAGLRAPVPLTLGWTPRADNPAAGREAEEVRRQLQASGLFRVTLRQAPGPEFRRNAGRAAYDLFQQVRTSEIPDGDGFVTPVLRPGGVAANGYTSATATRLIEQETAGQSLADRQNAFGDLQRLVATDVPVLPVWQGRTTLLAGAAVTGTDVALDRLSGIRYGYLSHEN
jgi:peptide/nickel transport system substrate-binding protein